jgi:hypothetical protein
MKVSPLIEKADALWDEQNMEVVKCAEVELLQRPKLPQPFFPKVSPVGYSIHPTSPPH